MQTYRLLRREVFIGQQNFMEFGILAKQYYADNPAMSFHVQG